jgi:hypothetical protein
MPHRLRLRRFLYLDETLTDNFLAQLEGGVYKEESQTTTTGQEKKRGAGGGVGPVKAELSGSRTGEDVTSRTVKQLADGAFARLAKRLEEDDAVQWLEALDSGIWTQLRRGEVLEVEATLVLPTLFQFTAMASWRRSRNWKAASCGRLLPSSSRSPSTAEPSPFGPSRPRAAREHIKLRLVLTSERRAHDRCRSVSMAQIVVYR